MWLLGISVVVLLLKYFEIAPVADLSWWWIAGLFLLCFLWFEFGERIFGIDKQRRARDGMESARKERVDALFSDPTKKRKR